MIIGLLVMMGCSSDFEISDNSLPVPVIYSIIDPYDSVNYVRVGKTFKIKNQDDWATLNPDSLMYHEVEVLLHGKQGNQIRWTEPFTEISIVKDKGYFPSGNMQLFKLDHRLPINLRGATESLGGIPDIDSLILEVRVPAINLVTKSGIKLLYPVKVINYKSRYVIYVYGSYPSVYAISDPQEIGNPDFEGIYQQIDFSVHFKEYRTDGVMTKRIHWYSNKGWDENAYFISPQKIFKPMADLIPEDGTVLYRTLDSIDISLLRTSKVFNDFLYIRDTWNMTTCPPFTNFDHSFGLFFSVTAGGWTGMLPERQSMDSLCFSPEYKSMKFRK